MLNLGIFIYLLRVILEKRNILKGLLFNKTIVSTYNLLYNEFSTQTFPVSLLKVYV